MFALISRNYPAISCCRKLCERLLLEPLCQNQKREVLNNVCESFICFIHSSESNLLSSSKFRVHLLMICILLLSIKRQEKVHRAITSGGFATKYTSIAERKDAGT